MAAEAFDRQEGLALATASAAPSISCIGPGLDNERRPRQSRAASKQRRSLRAAQRSFAIRWRLQVHRKSPATSRETRSLIPIFVLESSLPRAPALAEIAVVASMLPCGRWHDLL